MNSTSYLIYGIIGVVLLTLIYQANQEAGLLLEILSFILLLINKHTALANLFK